jgi:hypothetical protein
LDFIAHPEVSSVVVEHQYFAGKDMVLQHGNILPYIIPHGSLRFNSLSRITNYDWEIHKGHLEVFDKYVFRCTFDISVFIALK